MESLSIPRAAELRAPRRGTGGRPYVGPKVQVHVHEADYDAVIDEMEARGWTNEDYPEMLREVFAAGVVALRTQRGVA